MEIIIEKHRKEWLPLFEQLNRAWIEKYFELEDIDHWVLSQPEKSILEGGGEILFALYRDKVIGVVALKKMDEKTMELTKMAVDFNYQGLGAGKMLCLSALQWARDSGASKVVLYTQTALQTAISIYRKIGFKEVPLELGKYKRADTKMEFYFQ